MQAFRKKKHGKALFLYLCTRVSSSPQKGQKGAYKKGVHSMRLHAERSSNARHGKHKQTMVLHWVAMYAHNSHAAASLVRVSYSSMETLHHKKLISCTASHHTHLAYDEKRVI